jgi:superfamily I DNA/RNA helicase
LTAITGSTQPILTAADAVIDLAAERYQKNLRSDCSSAERPQLVSVRDETDQARYVSERGPAQATGRGVPRLASQRATRNRADSAQHNSAD